MALPVQKQLTYWGIATAAFFALLWLLGGVILPFLVAGAIAYLIDPVADRLEEAGLSRVMATVLISIVAVVIFVVAALLVIPLIIQQGLQLFNAAPEIFRQFQTFVDTRFPTLLDEGSPVRNALAGLGDTIKSQGAELVNGVLTSAMTVVNGIVFIVVVPVVTFYLLLDWDHMVANIDGWLPVDHRDTIRQLAREVDAVLAGFVRGQLSVCGILGLFYALSLMLVGLQYGLAVGAVAGLISFIPYVGSITGGVLAIGLALFQFWDTPLWIGLVIAIFAAGQFIEGNFLTPKLVGGSVGLHPVWLLFALSAFGTLFGFAGMLIAVPVAAVLGVLARFGLRQYLSGRLYRGLSQSEDDGA
jgi:predicted PurR-regulated permease PerM